MVSSKRAVEFCNDDAVVIRVGYEQPITFCVGENLARKGERQFADFRAFEHEFERLFVQFARLARNSAIVLPIV